MNESTHDPIADPRLSQELAGLDPTPVEEVDWAQLHASIADRAAMPLARRRREPRRAPRWLRPAIPAAIAAGLAAVVATQMIPGGSGPAERFNGDVPTAFHPTVEQVLGTEMSEFELDLLFGQFSADMLVVAAAVDQP